MSESDESEDQLVEALEAVHDRETFLTFVRVLTSDCEDCQIREKQAPSKQQGYGAFGWQNTTIPTFLDAAVACLEAMEDHDDFLREPSWSGFAQFLYSGKVYE